MVAPPRLVKFARAALVVCVTAVVGGAAQARDGGPTDAGAAASHAGAPQPRPVRVGFVVERFDNARHMKALDYLEAGLPAIIAERLAQHVPLRFVGGPFLLPPRATTEGARYVVRGSFERRPDWKLAVRVDVGEADAGGAVVASAERSGTKDEVAQVGLEAALAAFAAVPGLTLPPPSPAVRERFGRDPYAFVLYGRGVSVYAALGPGKGEDRARELLMRSLVVDPKVPEARRYLGLLHLEGGRPGHARAMWSYALDLRPRYAAALSALAALDRTAGLPIARERYGLLLEADPDDLEARRAHGELLAEAGRLDEAQRELERVLALVPSDLRARRALALVLASRHAGSELASELETIVRLDPDDLDARLDLGAAYLSIGKLAEATDVYEEVLKHRPRNPTALKLAADLWRMRGDVKRAAAHYERLRRVAPTDPRPVFLLGAAYYAAGNYLLAQRMFEAGAQYPGMLPEAYANLGAIALKEGKPKEALFFLSRAAKRRPHKAQVRYNHALALRALERHADALNELRAAQAADPNDAGVHFLAGVVALRLGLLVEAERDFREALRLDPQHDDARHNQALLEPVVHPRQEGAVSTFEGPVPFAPVPPPGTAPAPRGEPGK